MTSSNPALRPRTRLLPLATLAVMVTLYGCNTAYQREARMTAAQQRERQPTAEFLEAGPPLNCDRALGPFSIPTDTQRSRQASHFNLGRDDRPTLVNPFVLLYPPRRGTTLTFPGRDKRFGTFDLIFPNGAEGPVVIRQTYFDMPTQSLSSDDFRFTMRCEAGVLTLTRSAGIIHGGGEAVTHREMLKTVTFRLLADGALGIEDTDERLSLHFFRLLVGGMERRRGFYVFRRVDPP